MICGIERWTALQLFIFPRVVIRPMITVRSSSFARSRRGTPCRFADGGCGRKDFALLFDRFEDGVLVDGSPPVLQERSYRQSMFPERCRWSLEIGVRNPQMSTVRHLQEDSAEIIGVVTNGSTLSLPVDQQAERTVEIRQVEEMYAVTAHNSFYRRQEVTNKGVRVCGQAGRKRSCSIAPHLDRRSLQSRMHFVVVRAKDLQRHQPLEFVQRPPRSPTLENVVPGKLWRRTISVPIRRSIWPP